jgi:hypothetical protein
MALYEGTEFVKGQVKDTNFGSYTPLRIGGVPELDIVFINSTEPPVGLGEPGTTVVAPAIGNAIFAAVGVRCTTSLSGEQRCSEALTSQRTGHLHVRAHQTNSKESWERPVIPAQVNTS